MSRARIAVLVSGGGTNLQALLDAQQSGILHSGEIVLVVSNHENAYALERAAKASVDTSIVTKKGCGSQAAFEHELARQLEHAHIDLVILAGFMSILTKSFTDRFPNRMINVHPSLIPSFCGEGFYGLRVHQAALDYGVKVTGATVIMSTKFPTAARFWPKRPWTFCPRTRRKPCSAGLWSRPNGFFCPRWRRNCVPL